MKWNNLLRFTFHNTVSVAPLIPDPSHNSGFFQTIFATALLTAVVQGWRVVECLVSGPRDLLQNFAPKFAQKSR